MKKLHQSLIAVVFMLIANFSFAQNNAVYPANSLTPGSQNSTMGHNAGPSLLSASQGNTFIGVGAGFKEEKGAHNTAIGGFSSLNVVGGYENTTLGYYAGSAFTIFASKYNVNVGAYAGNQVKGNGNIFIGWKAGENAGNFSEKLYINTGTGTPLIYGDFSKNIAGINTTAPLSTFDVRGSHSMVTDLTTSSATLSSSRAAITGQTDGNSCKLYGFRAQTDKEYLVMMGMNKKTPTIFWGAGDLNFAYRNNTAGNCSVRLLRLGNNVANSGRQFYLNGSGYVTGSWTVISDRKVKKDVTQIGNAIDLVKQLNGVSYNYNQEAMPDMVLPKGRVYGFIAQDVQKVIPEVTTDLPESGLVGIKYTEIIPLLTEAIKEQQGTIETQNEKITALEDRLATIEKMLLGKASTSAQENKLNNEVSKNVQLGQNRPNPFGNTTIIDYNLPEDVQNAQLEVFSINGKLMQRTQITSGKGSVELDANTLKNGTYVYTINIDGKNIATKIMIVQK